MAQRDREEIRSALCAKGFLEENNDHYFYYLIYNSKRTSIYTKISKGSNYRTIQRKLLSLMSKQLKLSNTQFLDFVDCNLSGEKYLELLKQKNILE